MKRILLIMAILISLNISAQVTIHMEEDGGVFKVPCTVNGVKMKFIFDTGASSVSISKAMAQFLYDGEYLSSSDIRGSGQSIVADGTIVDHTNIILRDIEIGSLHLHDIQATVIDSQNAPLLLGQTAISELGRITIDGDKLIVHSAGNVHTEDEIDKLCQQALAYKEAESFAAAIECFERIDEFWGLSQYGLLELCYCYYQNSQHERCVQVCNRWISEYDGSSENIEKIIIYGSLADSYKELKDYSKALLWYQKKTSLLSEPSELTWNKRAQADCYRNLGQPYRAKELIYDCITERELELAKELGYTHDKLHELITNGKIHDEDLGMYHLTYALANYDIGDDMCGTAAMIFSALLGNTIARNYCIDSGFRILYPAVKWNF